tara:strand:+ start:950 stop:1507 length:558 start_codon:yes stop_codon:yes gene_type:complete
MREDLLQLLKKYAYRKGDFTLSSGKTSQHYVNCKPVTLRSDGLWIVSDLLLQHVDDDVVAGLTLGADPLVSGACCLAAAHGYKLRGLIIRKEPKGHGTASQVEGPLPPVTTTGKGGVVKTKITVLEDVVTTGGSALKAVKVLRDLGYEVNRVVTIVDRQEGGRDAMIEANLELCSLFTIEDLCQE